METHPDSVTDDTAGIPISAADLDSINDPSKPFVGNWHAVVSQTNWEKGEIISKWREKLQDSGVAPRLCSDPAWSRLVGEVTPQHVGRLRRTWSRFGERHNDFEGLFWSHFFAALDWNDAEMWLEGAVQNNWSVSKMRYQRWETRGGIEGQRPDPLEIVSSLSEEGVRIPAVFETPDQVVHQDEMLPAKGPVFEGPDFGEENNQAADTAKPVDETLPGSENQVDIDAILKQLPVEISKPFADLRRAIDRQRNSDWTDVKRIHIVALVNDLRQLLRKQPAREEPVVT